MLRNCSDIMLGEKKQKNKLYRILISALCKIYFKQILQEKIQQNIHQILQGHRIIKYI